MEVLCQVKLSIFVADKDLMEFNTSDTFTFSSCYTDEVAALIHHIILIELIVSSNHVDKAVARTNGCTSTWIKVKDELPK